MPEYIFIYDHDLLNGKEESDYDPMDAILYFHPMSTSIDIQLPLCSHSMGFCQILSNVFQSPPALFTLESGAMVYCIHEPETGLVNKSEKRTLTFALYSDETLNSNIKERCTFLYEGFIFCANKCLNCMFINGSKKNSKYISNLINKLLTLLNRREPLSLIFNSSFFCDPKDDSHSKSMDSLFYQSIVNIMDSIQNEAKSFGATVLGGCLFYKQILIMNQLPGSFVNVLGIFIDSLNSDNDSSNKDIFSSVRKLLVETEEFQTRNGVYNFKVCLTNDRYNELMAHSGHTNCATNIGCCTRNSFHNIDIYIEKHSNMTMLFLLEEQNSTILSKETLTRFSNLCFSQLSVVANISNNISMATASIRKCSYGPENVWNIIYDRVDQSLSVHNSSQTQTMSVDWEESLIKRVAVMHDVLANEDTITEVQVKLVNETLSAVRLGTEELYTVKS